MHKQQVLGEHARVERLGIEADAQLQGREPDGDRRGQGDQMDGIDPRQARPKEGAVVEPSLGPGPRIDVAEDETRQDEEEVDAEVALGGQAKALETKVQVVAEMILRLMISLLEPVVRRSM